MDAQSQRLSLHPLDQQSWLRNAAICNFITALFSLHPYISSSPHKLSQYNPFLFINPPFLFDSLGLLVPVSLKVTLRLFLLARLACLFFFHSLLFDFFFDFYARCLIKQLQKSKFAFLYLCSHLPLCASFPCFSSPHCFLFFFVSVFMLSGDWKKPQNRKCGCLWTRMRESVPVSLTLPLCQCLPLGCQWQSEFICCAVTGLMIDVAPANSKPIRRLM